MSFFHLWAHCVGTCFREISLFHMASSGGPRVPKNDSIRLEIGQVGHWVHIFYVIGEKRKIVKKLPRLSSQNRQKS